MDKENIYNDLKIFSDKYKVIASLSVLSINMRNYSSVLSQNLVLKNLFNDILNFVQQNCGEKDYNLVKNMKSEDFPEYLEPLKTVDIYNKILALKYSCVSSEDLHTVLKFNELSIEFNPKEEIPYLNIANILFEKEKYLDAIKICEKIQSFSNTPPVKELLGKIYRKLGQYDLAIDFYKQYLDLNENDENALDVLYEIYNEALSVEKSSLSGDVSKNYVIAMTMLSQNLLHSAFWKFAQLLVYNPNNIDYIKGASISLIKLKAYKIVKDKFLSKLEPYKNSDPEILSIIGAVYFGLPEFYKKAIPYYEKLLEVSPKNADANYRLAFLYERVYQDVYLDKQIQYAEKALNLGYDRNTALTLLARLYYRNGDKISCKNCFEKLLKNNPKPEEKVIYARFLMKDGNLSEGYDWYRARFDAQHFSYPKILTKNSRWDGKESLKDKTVIVHYEQGFGDSVMFSRYIPKIANLAKKVIFVVQKNLIPIFKSSGFENYCEILSHEADINPYINLEDTNKSVMYGSGLGMSHIPHDFHIPLMDTPFLFNESADNITGAYGYLKADENKIKEFKNKYINNNNKLKIGLAYHGTKESILTYRDISIKKFLPLFKMDNVEFYSFQSDIYADEIKELDPSVEIFDLGKLFENFEDTACAMNCMDLIISTDNVVMNLAGALGIKTFALFNVFTESRWFKTKGDDIGWYKSVKPFQVKSFNQWDQVIMDIKKEIINEFNI